MFKKYGNSLIKKMESITISVGKDKIPYEIEINRPFEMMFETCCMHYQCIGQGISFLFKSRILLPEETPAQVGMVNGDCVEMAVVKDDRLTLNVTSQSGNGMTFRVKQNTDLKRLMDAYCQRSGNPGENLRFLFDGQRIVDGMTPEQLDMRDGDEIDAMAQQVGGFFINCDMEHSAPSSQTVQIHAFS